VDVAVVRDLVTVRLPRRYEPLQLTFYGEQSRPSGEYVVIGDDYGTELRVRMSDGAVFSIDPDGALPTRFVNSSVERLCEFIAVYQSYGGRTAADTEVSPTARRLRGQLAAVDPAAFGDTENWWAVVLEQASDGLL
jgi:predicted component of type VI protein secretion system